MDNKYSKHDMHIKGINQENGEVYINNTRNRKAHLHGKRGLIQKQNNRYNDKAKTKNICKIYIIIIKRQR